MNAPSLQVIYEDNHVLAVRKPAGLATMGLPGDKPTLLTLAKQYVKNRYQKPGNVYLGVMSRLDTPVTGVVLLARTSKAARRFTEQFRTRAVQKTYWALVEGDVEPVAGEWVDWILTDKRNRKVRVVAPSRPEAKDARLAYRRLELREGNSLIQVEPRTGRKHQIRVQLARRGHPILGDRKYGSRRAFPVGIALHARRLVVSHPVGGKPLVLECPLPAVWRDFGVEG
jgi:23S rRNA pseudouridine1911/1915/1917 synthase